MVVFTEFGLFRLVAAVLGVSALAAIAAPASAKPLHRHHAHASNYTHHAASRHAHHHRRSHVSRRHARVAQQSQFAPAPFGFAGSDPSMNVSQVMQPQMQPATQRRHGRRHRVAAQQTQAPQWQSWSGGGAGSNLVATARSYIGSGNPTGRSALWCARFMNMVLERSGHSGTGSDMASSFARYGQRISGPQVGAIAVMSRGKRGGHVGVVSGIDPNGNPIVVSGNHGRRVAEAVYSKSRIYAYVMPSS